MIPEWKSGIQLHRMTWNSSIWIFMIEVSTWHFSDLESIRREKSQISSTSSETWYYKFFVFACECSQALHIIWNSIWTFFLNDRKKKTILFVYICNLIFKPKFWLFKKIHIDFYIGKIPYNKNSLGLFFNIGLNSYYKNSLGFFLYRIKFL